MFGDSISSNPLEGTWEGYYDHHDKVYASKNFPITATIEQVGRSFRGIMIDGVTDIRHLYRKVVEANEDRLSASDEGKVRRFLEEFPDSIIESNLPEESRIEGQIIGDDVRFTKTYLGDYSTFWTFGGRRTLLRRIAGHRVLYQGTLSTNAGTIEGGWIIRHRGLFGPFLRPRATGCFQLFRK